MKGATRREAAGGQTAAEDLRALCDPLFASLTRSDQRARAAEYVEGLLVTEGRRSFRNMAACLGHGTALEQRLHHFVSCSTWDWMPVRRALAARAAAVAPLDAWVLRPMLTPKEGDDIAGVHRRYVPDLGAVRNVQYAVGLWSVSGALCQPVNWKLLHPGSPDAWTDRPGGRPACGWSRARTPAQCAMGVYLDLLDGPGRRLPSGPVVMDVDGVDVIDAVRRLRAARLRFLVKVSRAVPLGLLAPAPLPGAEDLLLFGCGTGGGAGPDEVWLTDLLDAGPAELVALAASARTVEETFARVTDPLGARDFTGRTFEGWHRHLTLVSVAHAARTTAPGPGPSLTTESVLLPGDVERVRLA
ncbi:transposase [Streptomyces sp. NPDC006544]|uniref:IS701 family transposase n=1 Tax=Streptomyces sp. NPDC006544 TaxID=3154583 RepID=UPI0033A88DB8